MGNARLCAALALLAPLTAGAQWLHRLDPTTPRGRDGKPDFSGIWQAESTPRNELAAMFPPGVGLLPGGVNGLGEDDPQKYFLNILADFKPGAEPLTPAAGARMQARLQKPAKPVSLCSPPGVPATELIPSPYKIVQTPSLLLLLYESDTIFRQIHLDGRRAPVDPQPAWLGYSVGRWEGDTLVVDVTGMNDLSDLDAMGHFHSEALHVTERFRRRDFGHIEIEITLDDPRTFSQPVTIRSNQRLLPDTEVMESFCTEAEHDLEHLRAIKP